MFPRRMHTLRPGRQPRSTATRRRSRRTSTTRWACPRTRGPTTSWSSAASTTTTSCVRRTAGARAGCSRSSSGSGACRRVDTKPEGLDGEFARRVIKLMASVNVRGLPAHPWPRRWHLAHRGRLEGPGADLPGRAPRPSYRQAAHHPAGLPARRRPGGRGGLAGGAPAAPAVVPQPRGRPDGHRPDQGRPEADAGPHRGRRPSAPSCGRGSSTSTATTTPTSRGPTARSRSWSSSRAEPSRPVGGVGKFPVSRGRRSRFGNGAHGLLTRRGRRTKFGPIASPGGRPAHLTCDPGRPS